MDLSYLKLPAGTAMRVTKDTRGLKTGDTVLLAISSEDMNRWLKSSGFVPHKDDGSIWVTLPENFQEASKASAHQIYFYGTSVKTFGMHFDYDADVLQGNKYFKNVLESI